MFLLQVNENFAIDLIREEPVIVCEKRVVASDSGGALGHPKVFINLVSHIYHRLTNIFLVTICVMQCMDITVVYTFISWFSSLPNMSLLARTKSLFYSLV